ncbi:PAS domain-containing sensor histidine kinase [Bacillus sp. FJAT-27225]|uniref:PAS domain-containing sensor histidine kinase n=1 Tax=Bacillus sp. FJAT-27225 TaxID=1743144 RepID=UPI00080C2BF2|nr:PAS domain S-box protein [Bacillus sp. FJAT-27225]OCA83292.1 PAS domain-containing sensor histidine kinase [Bacillus sp. FJAT-27225]
MSSSYPLFGGNKDYMVYNPDELIDLFLTNTADGFAIVGMDNRYIRVNPTYCKIFGYEEYELLGRQFNEFVHPDEVSGIFEEVKKGKIFSNILSQRYHKNGQMIDIAVSYSPFRNSSGEIIAVIGIFRDITGSRNLERELKKSRELYRLITENTTDLITVLSNTKNKTIIFASPSYKKVCGIDPAQLVGRSVYDFLSKKEAVGLYKIIKCLSKKGEPVLFENEIKLPRGDMLYLEYNISAIHDEHGEIDSFLTVARNITDRVRNETAIRNLDRLSIIGQLAAGVAHEIRNPLTSLKGFSKLLLNDNSKEKQEQYLEIVRNELDRIDMIVNEFMSLAKPQAIRFERANLYPILDGTVNIIQPQALLHNVEIKTNYPAEDIALLCSPNQLKQVFVNFLKNSIEAMPNGGNITIKVEKTAPDRVNILFRDEGSGIDPEIVRYLGTPFYTTKDKGIGLGLTVSNKIIQEHNGEMKISSQVGVGTDISLELACLHS